MISPITRTRPILSYLRATLLAHVCLLAPQAYAIGDSDEFQKAVSAQINELVIQDVETYFRQLHLEEPVKVETTTEADIDTSGAVPRVTQIRLNVNVVTDQPSQVVRQARHRLVRILREQGYRFDSSEGPSGDSKPLAALTIQTTIPPPTQSESEQTWVYVGFAGLIIALLTSVLTLLYVLFLPWIRWSRARKKSVERPQEMGQHEPTVQDVPPFPVLPRNIARAEEKPKTPSLEELPPLPPLLHVVEAASPKTPHTQSSIEVGGWSTLSQPD